MAKEWFAPRANRVLLRPVEVETTRASGLVLAGQEGEVSDRADVIAVGDEVSGIEVGQRVVYAPYAGAKLTINDEEFLVVLENEIIGKVEVHD